MEINNLTPVEEYDGLLYKRDDSFLPFGKLYNIANEVKQPDPAVKADMEKYTAQMIENMKKLLKANATCIITSMTKKKKIRLTNPFTLRRLAITKAPTTAPIPVAPVRIANPSAP